MRLIYRVKQLILLSGDLAAYYVALVFSLGIRNGQLPSWDSVDQVLFLFSAVFLIWIIINYINGLYDLGLLRQKLFWKRFIETALMALVVSIAFFYILPSSTITPKTILLLTVMTGYALSFVWRSSFQYFFFGAKKRLQTNVVIVGYNAEAKELIDLLGEHSSKGYTIVALIDPDHVATVPANSNVRVYDRIEQIRIAITEHQANLVVIAPHLRQSEEAMRELYELLFCKVQINDVPSFYEIITGRIPPSIFSEGWFLDHLKSHDDPIYNKVRSVLDYIATAVLGIMFVVLLPFISLGIKLNSPGPIFIRQRRVGQFGEEFTIYKFRSMYALSPNGSAELSGVEFAVKNDRRITSFGKFLRKTRLDELPQCWNLFRRHVTLVGPRPERPEIVKQLEQQMPYYRLRHSIKPGITGWAAIQQHYTDTLETSLQKLQYDLYYIKNKSMLLDVSILLRTINIVVRMMGQ